MNGSGDARGDSRARWLLLAVAAVLLVAGARHAGTQGLEATLLGLGVPLLAIALGFRSLLDAKPSLRLAAGLVALVALVVAEAEIGRLFFPPAPVAQATLSEKSPDAELSGVAGDFELETRCALDAYKGSAQESFVIDVERAGAHQQIEGTFSRSAATTRASRRRAPTQTSSHTLDDYTQTVSLPGVGPIHAHLVQLTGDGPRALELSLRPALPGGRALEWALLLSGLLAVAVQVSASRQGDRTHFATWVGMACVLALYLPRHFSRSDPMGAMVGALFVALVAGGLGGFVLGSLATRLFGRSEGAAQ